MQFVSALFAAAVAAAAATNPMSRLVLVDARQALLLNVASITIVEKGTFRSALKKTVRDKTSPSGATLATTDVELVADTDTIRAKPGVQFGIRYVIHGRPKGSFAPIKIVERYPQPGLHNPRSGKTTLIYQQNVWRVVGYAHFEGYRLDNPWEVVPGVWVFEIWYKGRMVAEQKFHVLRQ